ncbi:hypothetical protein QBC40DRAFT_258851 [Triangularia verruculosa]|uniref:2OG-Fe(II) oxygenase n=1 Tax=Triangularia verruculosa TaxID=2587418 RepID=A0AAN7ANT1_9PEZI|nr:hypothetical protein QBC40DRAFT_258851 [Triangularia verruculosa]
MAETIAKSGENILTALRAIETSGSFASSGTVDETPPAGIFIDGIGDIPMPLSETQAREIITKCRQAPYGRGSDTIVDTSVRNTWELDAAQFSFRDPRWSEFVQRLCEDVAEDLGIETPIRAEIYKMLIYEEGGQFKPHTEYALHISSDPFEYMHCD